MNIFVGSLSFKTTEEELQKEFDAFGEVGSVKIILDRETFKSRGFAFVTMPNQDQATAAIAGLNGKEINGFALKVNEARPRDSQAGPPRERSGAGYGGGSRTGSGFGSTGGGYKRDRTSVATDPGTSRSTTLKAAGAARRAGGAAAMAPAVGRAVAGLRTECTLARHRKCDLYRSQAVGARRSSLLRGGSALTACHFSFGSSIDSPFISPSMIFLANITLSMSANSLPAKVLSQEKVRSFASPSESLLRTIVTSTFQRSLSGS